MLGGHWQPRWTRQISSSHFHFVIAFNVCCALLFPNVSRPLTNKGLESHLEDNSEGGIIRFLFSLAIEVKVLCLRNICKNSVKILESLNFHILWGLLFCHFHGNLPRIKWIPLISNTKKSCRILLQYMCCWKHRENHLQRYLFLASI